MADSDWDSFVRAWLEELSRDPSGGTGEVAPSVTLMSFTARPQHQWQFILKAVALVDSDDGMGHIAAGPLEHLLGWHGEVVIEQVEERSARDPKFARVLTGVWRYRISDSIWARVRALQARVAEPLPGCIPFETPRGGG
jgi:hypothetical protein